MKLILVWIIFSLAGVSSEKYISIQHQTRYDNQNFKLHFMTIGFGSNMYEMEPVFKVEGTKFVYTSEEVWIDPGQEKIERDTLLTGDFRASSADSILNFINRLQDTLVDKAYIHAMSGSACSMGISNNEKKIRFWLYNTSDTTADKIVSILNTYIPKGYGKLHIHEFK